MNHVNLMAVATYPSTFAAQIAQGLLEAEGIESMIRADNAGGMYPALSGAELLVKSEDAERASEVLTQHLGLSDER